jgi:tagaturonate epimerase
MIYLEKYSIGLGDRFGHQGNAQLKAIIDAALKGVEITPVWNKSNREHNTIGTHPEDVRIEADTATTKAGFKKPYFVDADHINFETVDRFIGCSDFFTIDVASEIGHHAGDDEIAEFLSGIKKKSGTINLPGTNLSISYTEPEITEIARKYLSAIGLAGRIYRKIESKKDAGSFITEISMDEVAQPQSPSDLFFILKMIADAKIPVRTLAPKFSGRFNKGVDYKGDPHVFAKEFESDLSILELAVKEFGLPEDLKMSIHSGSDKFAIYPVIGALIRKHDKGIHVKTAGTTWLEEVTGLAISGKVPLEFVKELYFRALEIIDELILPYSDVIDINVSSLPLKKDVKVWSGEKFAASLRHISGNNDYNPDLRQLMHVAYKIAAERINEFSRLVDENQENISSCVYENIYTRHICRLFEI